MTYKKVIAGSLGAVVALGTFATFGVSPLFAATTDTGTTTVNIQVQEECGMGVNGDSGGAASMTISGLSATNPSGEATATSTPIDITCNSASGWTLTEQMNEDEDQILNVGGLEVSTVGFGPWTGGTAVSGFAANTWGMKYAQVAAQSGASVTATAYHAVPANGAPSNIASSTAPTVSYGITQTFGANTNGLLPTGTYTGIILYTLTGV